MLTFLLSMRYTARLPTMNSYTQTYNSHMEKKEKSLTIRLTLELLEDMRALARQHDRSLNGEILTALREYITRYKQEGSKG